MIKLKYKCTMYICKFTYSKILEVCTLLTVNFQKLLHYLQLKGLACYPDDKDYQRLKNKHVSRYGGNEARKCHSSLFTMSMKKSFIYQNIYEIKQETAKCAITNGVSKLFQSILEQIIYYCSCSCDSHNFSINHMLLLSLIGYNFLINVSLLCFSDSHIKILSFEKLWTLPQIYVQYSK